MYEYIKGKVTDIQSGYIVLENNGIGYLIYTANPYSFNIDEEYKLYVYQYIREERILYMDLKVMKRKIYFLRLTSVKGLGCRWQFQCLQAVHPEGIIDAIEREIFCI